MRFVVRTSVLAVLAGMTLGSAVGVPAASARVSGKCGAWATRNDKVAVGQAEVVRFISGGSELQVTLRWGDGASSSLKLDSGEQGGVSHAYSAPGVYKLALSVKTESNFGECEESVSLGTVKVS